MRGTYNYIMRMRPFGIGCQPKGQLYVISERKKDKGYHSLVGYPRPLDDWELKKYEMEYLDKVDRTNVAKKLNQ